MPSTIAPRFFRLQTAPLPTAVGSLAPNGQAWESVLNLPLGQRMLSLVFGRSATLLVNGGHGASPLRVTPRRHRLSLANRSGTAIRVSLAMLPYWIIARRGSWLCEITPLSAGQALLLAPDDSAQIIIDFASSLGQKVLLTATSAQGKGASFQWDVVLPSFLPDRSFDPAREPWPLTRPIS